MQATQMIYSLTLLSIVGVAYRAVALNHPDKPPSISPNVANAFNYSAFLRRHGKFYRPLEEISRSRLFYMRSIDIFKSNLLYATNRKSHYLHQNKYIDLLPEELDEILLAFDSDLAPVKEARDYSETPAIELIAQASRRPRDRVHDTMSRSTLSDVPGNRQQQVTQVGKPRDSDSFDMSKRYPNVNPSELLQELVKQPRLMEQMSRYITINQEASESGHEKTLEPKRRKVAHEPLARPTNPKFDPSTIRSRGLAPDRYGFRQVYSDILMDDFLGILEPYPTPVFAEAQHHYEKEAAAAEGEDQGFLSSFMDSLRAFRDSFLIAGEDEIFENDAEKDKVIEESSKSESRPLSISTQDDNASSEEKGIKYKIDWRENGCIPRVKDQGACNSCYAFAVLDLLEYIYCRQTGVSTEFSAQYIIDCGADEKLEGCRGGKLSYVKNFINSRGLQVDSLYPYNGTEQTCRYQNAERDSAYLLKPEIRAWAMFSELIDWYKWIPTSPLVVGINMPTDFVAYGGGIHKGLDCVPKMVHAMLLVGAGKEDGQPFWLLKNNLSEEWGEKGYFRLSRDAPAKCFNSVFVARVAFKKGAAVTGLKRRLIDR